MREAINAAIIDDKSRLLIVKKKNVWILPGGKPKDEESHAGCLEREVAEELSGTKVSIDRLYDVFEGITPHAGDRLRAIVYLCSLNGELGNPSAEITDKTWITYDQRYNYPLSEITGKIVEGLRKDIRLTGF